MIDYPSNLPQPSVSLSGSAETPTIRTDLDSGLIEQTGRFATGRETYSVSWNLSQAELVIFENFFNNTLAGGLLIFGLMLPQEDGYTAQPVRFIGGKYSTRHKTALYWSVSATVEKMVVSQAPTNNTPAIPPWLRLLVDEAISQNLTLAHRNALLTVRPAAEDQTALRIYPPTDEAQYIYFGIDNQGDGETLITSEEVDPLPVPAVPVWPGALPGINQAFQFEATRQANRLEMDGGHSRQFAKFQTTIKNHAVEFDFTLEQLQAFQEFFYITLESGSLPFLLSLPLDGIYEEVKMRFVGGTYNESYIPNDMFRVSAKLDRITAQSVEISNANPYAIYYSPQETVTANRKIALADEGNFFIVNPDEFETINLHIGNKYIEFGILVIGLGNVLITRTPWPLDVGPLDDVGAGEFLAPSFTLESVIVPLSGEDEGGEGEFLEASFDLVEVLLPVTVASDEGGGEFFAPSFDIHNFLIELDPLDDGASGEFATPTFELATP